MNTTIKTQTHSRHECGFCSTGTHNLCPGGVLNGNKTEVVICSCTEHPTVVRCLNCGNKTADEVSNSTWSCHDADACQARIDRRRTEADQTLYPSREPGWRSEVKETPARTSRKPSDGQCLCCGDKTKGGRFLPGHDSRYLTMVVKSVNEHQATVDGVAEIMTQEGCSMALVAKFRKRVNA